MLSFTDGAPRQLRRFTKDSIELIKKKIKQCTVQKGKVAPLLFGPNGSGDGLFPNEHTVDIFVNSFLECVSLYYLDR